MFKVISFAAIVLMGAVSPMTSHAKSVIDKFREQLEGYRSDIKALRDEVTELREKLAENEDPTDKTDMTSIPNGAVVAFVHACPTEGWSPYYPAAGRFLIAAGPHGEGDVRNRDANGQPLSVYQGPDDLSEETLRTPNAANTSDKKRIGGVEKYALEPSEMPIHNHLHNDSVTSLYIQGDDTTVNGISGVRTKVDVRRTGNSGGGEDGRTEPHNNMPPYIALYFCKKEAG